MTADEDLGMRLHQQTMTDKNAMIQGLIQPWLQATMQAAGR